MAKQAFTQSKRWKQILDAVMAEIAPLKRGDTLTYDVIELASEIGRDSLEWVGLVEKVRKKLERDRGIAWINIPGVGYRLATVTETLTIVVPKRQRKAARQIRKGQRSLERTPTDGLNATQKAARATALDAVKRSARAVHRERRIVTIAAKPTQTIPQLPTPK